MPVSVGTRPPVGSVCCNNSNIPRVDYARTVPCQKAGGVQTPSRKLKRNELQHPVFEPKFEPDEPKNLKRTLAKHLQQAKHFLGG